MTGLGSRVTPASVVAATPRRVVVLLALLFLALHLPYLPQSLEDLDSINFALGVRQFDVAHHQPHPPGYPVFILIAKAVHRVIASEATALAAVSAAAAALGIVAIAALFRRVDAEGTPAAWRLMPIAVAMTTPLYWFTAVRPLSDSSGLAAALAVQAMTLAARTTSNLAIAAFCAGLAAGLRSQVVWLTVPLLIAQALGAGRWELAASPTVPAADGKLAHVSTQLRAPRTQHLVPVLAAFLAGILIWFLPLVILSGGPSAYWHALFDQGAEDLGNITMLWNNHRARDVADALYYAFVAPWAAWPAAAVALACAAAGVVRLVRVRPRALTLLAIAFGPYLVFDLLFQETFTGRYALPLVVPMAYLIVAGLRSLPWDTGLAVAIALAMFSAHVGGRSIAAYSRTPAPAFRLLEAMRNAPRADAVLAMDRRESLDLRRPMKWVGEATPAAQILAAPPQHEWLEAAKYWNGGGRSPLWFVVDPLRSSIDLVQHGEPLRFRWPLPYPVLLSGVRPNEMDWYRVDRPEWYVGEGWALTPESAGVAEADRRDPSHGPITAWVHGSASSGGTLMIGGRSLDPTLRPHFAVSLGRRPLIDETLMPGAFLRFVSLPLARRDTLAPAYDPVTVTTTAGARVAVEQFDASGQRSLIGFGDGWHEQELNPRSGARWRWLSGQGTLRMRVPLTRMSPDRREAPALVLHIEGESPLAYFPRPSMLTVRSGWRVQLTRPLNSDFALDIPITDLGPTGESDITLETDQTYVPADRSSRTQDRRHLGLRIFKAELRTGTRPAS
ncbi:MAG: hypothetical protein JWL71_2273 [Acidobacteria bacterium]|nr:hypothetical protein [Acidobacteriota bacterium]